MSLTLKAEVLLFDMDGTLLDAAPVIELIWTTWAARHGVDANAVFSTSQGQRTVDTVRAHVRDGVDLEEEVRWLSRQAYQESVRPTAMPGALALLDALPADRWAVVTSAERALAEHWLKAAGIPVPRVLVSGDDVAIGKPDPGGYEQAAHRLGSDASDAVVFEDSEAGVEAGKRAGARVIGVSNPQIKTHPSIAYWVADFTRLTVRRGEGYGFSIGSQTDDIR